MLYEFQILHPVSAQRKYKLGPRHLTMATGRGQLLLNLVQVLEIIRLDQPLINW